MLVVVCVEVDAGVTVTIAPPLTLGDAGFEVDWIVTEFNVSVPRV